MNERVNRAALRELAKLPRLPELDEIRRSLRLPSLVELTLEPEEPEAGTNLITECPETEIPVRLERAAGQRIVKVFRVRTANPNPPPRCLAYELKLGTQLTGYGSYALTFERDPGSTGLVQNFFRDISRYEVNLHRTFVFVSETFENSTPGAALYQLLTPRTASDPNVANVTTDYLNNLDRFVSAAKGYGIVVQLCLFSHHQIADSRFQPPLPFTFQNLGGSPQANYQNFFRVGGRFAGLQERFIDTLVTRLRVHWNVIFEVANEVRVPSPNPQYNDNHLRDWIDWVARRIKTHTSTHLVTCSTGRDDQNEGIVNRLGSLDLCSFHSGQWDLHDTNVGNDPAGIDAARLRASASYGDKHVVIDDDGSPGRRTKPNLQVWVPAALASGGGCRASFNHKGLSPVNAYRADWIHQVPRPGETIPIDALQVLEASRASSASPCARPV